jgi:DNA-binding IclR family transcriptional regulator
MDKDDLIDTDREILDVLEEGRCTPAALADWAALSKQTIHSRLNVLVAAGHVDKVHESGLYELADDPRSEG